VSLYGIVPLQAQVTSSFNFSRDLRPVTGWINAHGDPDTAATPLTFTDPATGFTISSVAAANWYGFNGGAAADGGGAANGTFFPAAVMANHWFQASDYYALYNAAIPQLEISGLNVDSVYTLKMTGSFAIFLDLFNLNPMRYTVTGAIVYGYVDVNGTSNTSDGAIFYNVAPNSQGKIKVYVNVFNGSNLASISGLQIIQGHSTAPTPTVAITHPANNDILSEDGYIVINATASETNGSIHKVEFYADTTKIGEDSTAPFSITWLNPDPGKYVLKARAIDGLGNVNSSNINVSVESLSTFWSTTGNIATNADTFFLGTVDTNRLAIRTNNIERVSVLGDGSVGIGTKTTHGYKLAVNGNGIFTKVSVRNYANWPDYVFKSDYKLPGLDSLERFIRVNQHLPGIISADKAKDQPIDLADNQALLLQKVEELTLYLIKEHKRADEEHKRVEELAKEVKALKAQLHPPANTKH
jgi:hypothetical protein